MERDLLWYRMSYKIDLFCFLGERLRVGYFCLNLYFLMRRKWEFKICPKSEFPASVNNKTTVTSDATLRHPVATYLSLETRCFRLQNTLPVRILIIWYTLFRKTCYFHLQGRLS